MSKTVFIDGAAGTTGLELASRLRERRGLVLLEIDPGERKSPAARQRCYEEADVVVLCLPDDAAREAVALADEAHGDVRILDASTAHRTAPGWVYGLPELDGGQRGAIRDARYVSNPGCYPTGFVLGVRPLIEAGLLSPAVPLRVHALSGFSGGGNKLIDQYAAMGEGPYLSRPYALGLHHKHVPEMQRYAGSEVAPLFNPIVGHYHQGMLVHVPLFGSELTAPHGVRDVHETLTRRYEGEPFITVHPWGEDAAEGGFLSPITCNGSNRLELMVCGHDAQFTIVARYDNLGKGASGAAVQNLNLMLSLPEQEGLT